jgi:GTPase SAR1 family protein
MGSGNTKVKGGAGPSKNVKVEECRLLLLGTGGSGKSTTYKQVQIHKNKGFTDGERKVYTDQIQSRMFEASKQFTDTGRVSKDGMILMGILGDQSDFLKNTVGIVESTIQFLAKTTQDDFNAVVEGNDTKSKQECLDHLKIFVDKLFPYIEQAAKSSEPSIYHIFRNREMVCKANFYAADEDILRFRVPTTGQREITVSVRDNLNFTFIDFGGQRSERKHWTSVKNISAIIYVVALDDYSKTLEEDATRNSMKESLALFRIIGRHFPQTPLIVLLNKVDVFEEKLNEHPLRNCFKSYDGGENVDNAKEYIKDQYSKACEPRNPSLLHFHYTCATDKEDMVKILSHVQEVVEKNKFK